MPRFALISALILGASAPAFAADFNLGVTSPAEIADQHDFSSDFRAAVDLGKTSPAEISGTNFTSNGDVISTQNLETLRLLGLTSPAEIAAAKR